MFELVAFLDKLVAAFDFVSLLNSLKDFKVFIARLKPEYQNSLSRLTFRELLVLETDEALHHIIVELSAFACFEEESQLVCSSLQYADMHQRVTRDILTPEETQRSIVYKLLDDSFIPQPKRDAYDKVVEAIRILDQNDKTILNTDLAKVAEDIIAHGYFSDAAHLAMKKLQAAKEEMQKHSLEIDKEIHQ